MKQTITDFFKENLSFWGSLSEEEREMLINRHQVMQYHSGQLVRGESTDCIGLLMVVSGALRAYLLSLEGRAVTLYRVKAGETCVLAVSCVLDAISFDTQIEAEEDTEVVLIPIDIYSRLVRNNLAVECNSYKTAVERFSEVVAGVERLVFLNLEQRLTSFLLDESAQTGSDIINMTHEQLAVHIGSAREAVSRSLKSLATQRVVELFRGGVKLLDKKALYQIIE
ncbi:MAG: Crp/Fnr family transcriptional regulator [Oscillospiraceae bacterium]|jgi:CRP/FNR family transcriptional regulator|nr:Crp/Fnr family transcriptional regulator [Oscillospiraceae bacterium]